LLHRYTTSGFTDTFGYPYYFFYRISVGSIVWEVRYYTTEKFRVDYRENNTITVNFRSEWVDDRRMTHYLQEYRNGILYDEKTAVSISGMAIGPMSMDKFEILDANYYVTLLDGVTVVYTPQSLAKFERPQLHVYRNKLKRKRILYRYSETEGRLIPTP
jgi:hypothetical protein